MENESLNTLSSRRPAANPREEKQLLTQQNSLMQQALPPHASALADVQPSAVPPAAASAAAPQAWAATAPAAAGSPMAAYAAAPGAVAPAGETAAFFAPPAKQLRRKPGLLKYILLSAVTLGIYSIVVMSGISADINTVASPHDNKKTMHYCLLLFLCSVFTLGIVPLIWYHRLSRRIGNEARRRGVQTAFGPKTFWLWGILGSLILVGPFIYMHGLLHTMNAVIDDYNLKG